MLKQRVITALILAPLILGAIYFLASPTVALILAVIVLIGAWEWAALSGFEQTPIRLGFTFLIGLLLFLFYPLIFAPNFKLLLGATCLCWLSALIMIIMTQRNKQLPPLKKNVSLVNGIMVLLPSWMATVFLHGHEKLGPEWVLFLFVLIWSADIGAYFAGKRFGRHKLADQISPGKSWEGVIGGLLLVLLVAGLILPLLTETVSVALILLCLITALISVLGDLTESLVKRIVGKKDSGTLLPGHGGVLDRIDSLTAAAPIFTAGLLFLGMAA